MERDHQMNTQEIPIQLSQAKEESFSRKPSGGSIGVGDRVKRDEWSEGAVLSLLEVYESKWALRNRAKLKGQDWEDVASYVSSKACNTNNTPKTPTQCKNKIESMKKRYRAESAGGGGGHVSSWPLFSRLHHLLGGPGVNGGGGFPLLPPPPPPQPSPPPLGPTRIQSLPVMEALTVVVQTDQPPGSTQNSLHSIGPQQLAKEERLIEDEAKLSDQEVSDGAKSPKSMETDSSTPALYGCKNRNSKLNNSKMKVPMEKRKRRRTSSSLSRDADVIIAESIRWLAEAVLKSEQVRMETTKEMEKMRADAEAKRAEIDLKKTEIIANTQLEIAKIFASSGGRSVGSSAMIKKN